MLPLKIDNQNDPWSHRGQEWCHQNPKIKLVKINDIIKFKGELSL